MGEQMAAILKFPTQPRDFASGYIAGLEDGERVVKHTHFLTGAAIGAVVTAMIVAVIFAVAR